MRNQSSGLHASSSAHQRALRTFCLLLKATTQVGTTKLRQIKDNEWLDQWEKIQQYLHSQQGAFQVSCLSHLLEHRDLTKNIDRVTLDYL